MFRIEKGITYAASLAPSFPVYFDCHPLQLVTALKEAGFTYVEETVTVLPNILAMRKKARKEMGKPLLGESCPKVISMIKEEFPHLIMHIPPVPSPMELHGRMLKQKYGSNCRTVFLSPCIYKKEENEIKQAMDYVITFTELEEILNKSVNTPLTLIKKTDFDSTVYKEMRMGVLVMNVHGFEACRRFLQEYPLDNAPEYTEILYCEGGCAKTAQLSSKTNLSPQERIFRAWEES